MPYTKIECSMRKGANIPFRIGTLVRKLCKKRISDNWQNIPVIINNYNRLECLVILLEWLGKAGMKKIYIIDNNSSYPPLLEFYKKTKYTVYKLDINKGHFSLWETVLFTRFSDQYYIYTDPDIIPIDACPLNAVKYFMNILSTHPEIDKVGFGLKIDDLPDYFKMKQDVINWEKQFWQKRVTANLYDAIIDTTFALYSPGCKGGVTLKSYRTGGIYTARHLPWYEDSQNLSEESQSYLSTASQSSSWYKAVKGENKQYSA